MSLYDGSNYECILIRKQEIQSTDQVTNLLHSYDWSRFDNIETKAVESEIRIKLRIHSIRTKRVDSTVLDMYGSLINQHVDSPLTLLRWRFDVTDLIIIIRNFSYKHVTGRNNKLQVEITSYRSK